MTYLTVFFRNLFRPNLTSVKVVLYENGKERNISTYDENRLRALSSSIDALWEVPKDSPYWFETEIYTKGGCFKKAVTEAEVICYSDDPNNINVKRKTGIPIRYRKKMFDKKHSIYPKLFSNIHWPDKMEVRFIHKEM